MDNTQEQLKEESEERNLNDYLPPVKFEAIPIKDLVSDQEYQRKLSMRHVRRTVANFDLYQLNPVKVSRRDGINYVFNGQHTMEIVAAISGSRDGELAKALIVCMLRGYIIWLRTKTREGK